jgi:hypothetical protein
MAARSMSQFKLLGCCNPLRRCSTPDILPSEDSLCGSYMTRSGIAGSEADVGSTCAFNTATTGVEHTSPQQQDMSWAAGDTTSQQPPPQRHHSSLAVESGSREEGRGRQHVSAQRRPMLVPLQLPNTSSSGGTTTAPPSTVRSPSPVHWSSAAAAQRRSTDGCPPSSPGSGASMLLSLSRKSHGGQTLPTAMLPPSSTAPLGAAGSTSAPANPSI